MTDKDADKKEEHRLGTINRWDAPEGDWAAEYDWTRYRGPDPWAVPGGWVFKDPEEGGWWQYYGNAGVGHEFDDSIREELEDDASVDDPDDVLEEARGPYAFLKVETANPDEVSRLDYENEKLEWKLKVDGTVVFRRVEPDRSDLMAAVAEALDAYHTGDLEDRVDEIVPTSGVKPKDVREQEELERREEENESLDRFVPDGGTVEDGNDRLEEDVAECEECGGEIDFTEASRYWKTADERFWHEECYDQTDKLDRVEDLREELLSLMVAEDCFDGLSDEFHDGLDNIQASMDEVVRAERLRQDQNLVTDGGQSSRGRSDTVEIDRGRLQTIRHQTDRILERGSVSTPIARDHLKTHLEWISDALAGGDHE